jgi:hypothetical protein
MDVAPVAEEYFKRLLHDTEPVEAVETLSNRWGVRAKPSGIWFGLSKPEHQVTMVLIYVEEVGNGGHTQFFSNRGGDIATRARAALRDIGLVELAVVLGKACAVFPDRQVPTDRAAVDRLQEQWGEEQLGEFGRLDRLTWRLDPCPRLIAYLREHEGELLRPERGLGEPR